MSRPVIMATPAAPLTMEEVKFWLEIMREHAVFIKLGLPGDETSLIKEAESFYKDFGNLLNRAGKIAGEKQFVRLVADSMDVLAEFLRFKRHLLHQMLVCRFSANNPPLMIDHMAREAEYVLALFGKIKDQIKKPHLSKARENIFWLRLMADHTKLLRGRIDPSERAIIHTIDDFSNEFDDLFLEANDFYSMLTHPGQLPPPALGKKLKKGFYGVMSHLSPASYDRFMRDIRVAVLRLRDFKKALHKMTEECRVVSILPPLLADHVRREADHFLMVLAMMEKGMISTDGDYLEPLESMDDDSCFPAMADSEYVVNEAAAQEELGEEAEEYYDDTDEEEIAVAEYEEECDDECDDYVEDEDEDEEDVEWNPEEEKMVPSHYVKPKFLNDDVREPASDSTSASQPDSVQTSPPQPEPTAEKKSEGQYKWSSKWPRPLGKVRD